MAYPLYASPRPWPWKTTPKELDRICEIGRLKENVVPLDWGGRRTLYVALSCGATDSFALFRLVRLKKDSIDRIDLDQLKEDLIRPGPSEWLGESVRFVIDTSSWLALGEHDSQIVSILGSWPETLLNQAFTKSGREERITFHPFPSKEFREVVLGRAIEKYFLKLGPVSVGTLEEEGFSASAITQIIADDLVTGLDVTISVRAGTGVDEGRATLLEKIAKRLRGHSAKAFKIRTEEGTLFDMLRENFVKYNFETIEDPQATSEKSHRVVLDKMQELLTKNVGNLRQAIPPIRSLDSFVEK
ncbi:MAG: hypothetical protein ACLPP2_02560 [Thermoplasmata archaeon]